MVDASVNSTANDLRDTVFNRFAAIRRHVRHDVVAPNKPLTLLWALDRIERGEPRLARFADAERELRLLLDAYASPGTAASYAFWRLQNDGLWEVVSSGPLPARSGNKEPTVTALRAHARGGFEALVHDRLAADPRLRHELADMLVAQIRLDRGPRARAWPTRTVRETVQRLVREATFRREVMAAFGSRCVVCAWGLVHKGRPVALIAAHVRPLGEGGPDGPGNGMPLCSLHHDLFDAGVFAYDERRRLIVSASAREEVSGDMLTLSHYAGRLLREPEDQRWRVDDSHLAWHHQRVFSGA